MGETWELVFAQKNVQLTGLDNSEAMSEQARKRAANHSDWKVTVLCEDALNSSVQDGSMDFVLSAFGLKTFSDLQLQLLAREISRVLRPGGQVSVVEISVPSLWLLRPVFMFYLRFLIPVIGKLFAGNSSDYRMLGVYCKAFGNSRKFQSYLEDCGIATNYWSYFYGCASGVVGVKT
jgi:demethylmenaquinone methyltransferase/2-methoxy-6-polyprenyl-1,4-benzoquinol methylase